MLHHDITKPPVEELDRDAATQQCVRQTRSVRTELFMSATSNLFSAVHRSMMPLRCDLNSADKPAVSNNLSAQRHCRESSTHRHICKACISCCYDVGLHDRLLRPVDPRRAVLEAVHCTLVIESPLVCSSRAQCQQSQPLGHALRYQAQLPQALLPAHTSKTCDMANCIDRWADRSWARETQTCYRQEWCPGGNTICSFYLLCRTHRTSRAG